MKLRRMFRCLAAAACMMFAGTAMAVNGYTVSLVTVDDCTNSGHVIVAVKLNSQGPSSVAGAQIFLNYDSFLSATNASITAGAGLQGIVLNANDGTHKATIAVGVTAPAQVIGDGDTIATIDFTYSGTKCATAGLVSIDSAHLPASTLTNNLAQSLLFSSSNLGSITLGDTTPPTITGGPVLTAITANNTLGSCSATISVSTPAATDNCTVASVVGTRSDNLLLSDPFIVGTTTITWTATDACGNQSTATQDVVVTDTENPVIMCGSDVDVSNDLNQCSAVVALPETLASDNCGIASLVGVRSDSQLLTDAYPVGTTTILWTATDIHGLTATCTQTVLVRDTQPPSLLVPLNFEQNADAGGCTLSLTAALLGTATYSDNCPGVSDPIISLTLGGPAITLPIDLPVGTTRFYWRVVDAHGNTSSQATEDVTVRPFNTMQVNVVMAGLGPVTITKRGINLNLYTAAGCPGPAFTVPCKDINFIGSFSPGIARFDVPCGITWTGVTATDPKHTLRRTTTISITGPVYFAQFNAAAGKTLQGGNINDDAFIDILDFGGYIGQFGVNYGTANTLCGTPGLNADFSANRTVGTEDFSFIQAGFLAFRDLDPCGGGFANETPVTDISVSDLVAGGLRSYAMADFNLDGRLNAADIAYVSQNGLPACAADFNDDQATNVQDIFSFLNAWFADHPKADLNNNTRTDVQDIFQFLDVWFQGC